MVFHHDIGKLTLSTAYFKQKPSILCLFLAASCNDVHKFSDISKSFNRVGFSHNQSESNSLITTRKDLELMAVVTDASEGQAYK